MYSFSESSCVRTSACTSRAAGIAKQQVPRAEGNTRNTHTHMMAPSTLARGTHAEDTGARHTDRKPWRAAHGQSSYAPLLQFLKKKLGTRNNPAEAPSQGDRTPSRCGSDQNQPYACALDAIVATHLRASVHVHLDSGLRDLHASSGALWWRAARQAAEDKAAAPAAAHPWPQTKKGGSAANQRAPNARTQWHRARVQSTVYMSWAQAQVGNPGALLHEDHCHTANRHIVQYSASGRSRAGAKGVFAGNRTRFGGDAIEENLPAMCSSMEAPPKRLRLRATMHSAPARDLRQA